MKKRKRKDIILAKDKRKSEYKCDKQRGIRQEQLFKCMVITYGNSGVPFGIWKEYFTKPYRKDGFLY